RGDRRDELRRGRSPAAVVGDQKHVAADLFLRELRFGRALDVAGEKHRAAAGGDAQHAAAVVAACGIAAGGMQELEAHAVPLPGVAGCAGGSDEASAATSKLSSTVSAPPMWSLSSCVKTTRSRLEIPWPRNAGT